MGNWTGMSSTVYDEPEYRTGLELSMAIYLMTSRDMLGVASVNLRVVSAKLRVRRKAEITAVLEYFDSIGKLIFSVNRSHVWWRSGAYHSLNRGKFSPRQLRGVVDLLSKWSRDDLFGKSFASTVRQLYATKYNIDIPIAYPTYSDTDTKAVAETDPIAAAPKADAIQNIDVVQSFESYVNESAEDLRMVWDMDFVAFGGSLQLHRLAEDIRRKIRLNREYYVPIALEGRWGDVFLAFMRSDIKTGKAQKELEKSQAENCVNQDLSMASLSESNTTT